MLSYSFHKVLTGLTSPCLSCHLLPLILGIGLLAILSLDHDAILPCTGGIIFLLLLECLTPFFLPGEVLIFGYRFIHFQLSQDCLLHLLKMGP